VKPRLSVCIATLNRADYLRETLHRLANEIDEATEIVIVDGNSTDQTPAVVEHLRRRLPQLVYRCESAPSNLDRDFDTAVSLASGDYCWLMSDDDAFEPGAFRAVTERLSQSPDVVIVNAAIYNEDFSAVLNGRVLQITADRCYRQGDTEQLFGDVGNYLSFIGAVVVRKVLWQNRNRERYFGSLFIHVGVLFQAPLPGDAIVIAAPLVKIRYGNAQWTSRSFEIWMFKWPHLIWSFEQFSETSRHMVCPAVPWRSPKTLLLYRAKGAYSLHDYQTLLRPRVRSYWYRAVAAAIACVPVMLANVIATAGLHVLTANPDVALLDLRKARRRVLDRLKSHLRLVGLSQAHVEAKR
jgi:glycosyltransferase involved in cell wall biosynthesis